MVFSGIAQILRLRIYSLLLLELSMKKFATLAAAVALFGAANAHASTVDVLLGSTDGFSYNATGTLNPNLDLTMSGVVLTGTSGVVSSSLSIPGYFTAPTGSNYMGEYLFVGANSSATFSITHGGSEFSLTWGTIDASNKLQVTDTTGHSFTVTGAQLESFMSLPAGSAQENVILNDPFGNIVTIEMTSGQNSFEASNFGRSTVPLPASAVLFAIALAGLALFGYRKSNDVA